MASILILYFSGVGNTKMIADYIFGQINSRQQNSDIFSIENLSSNFDISKYEKIVIGMPTIHSEPAKPMKEYIKGLDIIEKAIPIFIFTTCGLYSANTLRILAKLCLKKNLIPVMCRTYRCSAVDGMLLVPRLFSKHEKYLYDKIDSDLDRFLSERSVIQKIPRFKIYSIFNYPNKLLGQNYRFKIYINKNKCTKCRVCIINCPMKAVVMGQNGYPYINYKKCMNCYRCIYHCKSVALSLYRKNSL